MACTAYCLGKVCGDDGCGGSCGECDEGAACTDYGQCACIPNCEEKVCGNDGCGNTCGDCPGPQDNCIEGTCSCKSKCGETECGDIGINGANCLAVGVCAVGGVTASGIEEQGEFIWVCNYGQVVGYEGQEETVCDGKDNDCDVLIDEELDWEASNACSKLGVCDSPLLTASCEGEDGWYCLYALISEWEPEETSCDQLDNDCDGYVDEVACDVGEPCEDATNCVSGVCNLTPSGWDAFCSYALNYCVYISPYTGIVGIVDTGKAACADEKTAVLCGNGSWFKKADCSGASPVCWEGNCQVCAPGSLKCDGNNVVKCNSEASGWDNQKVCGEGTFCVGAGTCHTDSEFAISTVNLSPGQSINVDPKVASSASGGFSVVFTARSFPNGLETDILWRQFSSETTPIDIEEELVNKVVAGKQINADIDNFPREEGGYVVVWQDTNGPGEESEGWDIVAQILPEAGPAALPDSDTRILVNTTTDGSQTSPTVVAMVDGIFMVAWEHGEDGVDEPDIFAQRFSPDGSKFGDEFQVNTFFLYEQRFPALTRLADTGAAAIWASQGQADSWDVISQRFDKSFVKDGAEQMANIFTKTLQSFPAAAGFVGDKAGAYVVTWESFGLDAASLSIALNLFDQNGSAVYPNDLLANKLVQSGPQRYPAVAILDNNQVAVAWETKDLGNDDDQEGIAAKVFNADGTELTTDEFLVNQDTIGKQVNADIAAIWDSRYVVVWLSDKGNNEYSIRGRVFKIE